KGAEEGIQGPDRAGRLRSRGQALGDDCPDDRRADAWREQAPSADVDARAAAGASGPAEAAEQGVCRYKGLAGAARVRRHSAGRRVGARDRGGGGADARALGAVPEPAAGALGSGVGGIAKVRLSSAAAAPVGTNGKSAGRSRLDARRPRLEEYDGPDREDAG